MPSRPRTRILTLLALAAVPLCAGAGATPAQSATAAGFATPAEAPATAEAATAEYEAARSLAEKDAEDPRVAAYLERIGPDLADAAHRAFYPCAKRRLHTRRAQGSVVLTVAGDGSITRAESALESKSGLCRADVLVRSVRLPPPPVAPLRVLLAPR